MLKGRQQPRIYTPPLRRLTRRSTWGFAFVEFCEDVLGIALLPWQAWLAKHALEVVGDTMGEWRFRFRYIIILISRQNGKSLFSQLLVLFFIFVLQTPLVVGTAQNLEIAEEVWDGAIALAESIPALASMIEKVSRRNGKKELILTSGERYKIVAASRKGGRGLSADLVLMDELREQTNWDAWGAVTKTTMARPNAIVWSMSNAGDAKSVVLRTLRVKAHAALGDPDGVAEAIGDELGEDTTADESIGLFEWSAEPGRSIFDRKGWQEANPSLGYGFLDERALDSAAHTDPEGVFRTEDLCQWVEAVIQSPFPDGAWQAGTDKDSEIDQLSDVSFGIDSSADRTRTSIAVCGTRPDGEFHIELVAYRVGFDWVVRWFSERVARYGGSMRVGVQARGAPISAYIPAIEAIDGIEIVECEGRAVGAWTGRIWDAVAAHMGGNDVIPVWHRPQPALDSAANVAQIKVVGDGAFAWDRKASPGDISPLVAATMAFGVATDIDNTYYPSAYASDDFDGIAII